MLPDAYGTKPLNVPWVTEKSPEVRGQKVQVVIGSCPIHQYLYFPSKPKLTIVNRQGLCLNLEFVPDISRGLFPYMFIDFPTVHFT